VACRIFDDSGVPLGVVTMNVLLDNITQFVADMHLVEGGYGFLANDGFVLVAHYEEDFVTKHMSEIGSGFRQIIEIMEQGANFAKVDGYNYQGIRSVFYCERIENGWYLGIMTPRNVYYRDLRLLTLFLSALGFVLMLSVNFLLIRIDAKKSKLDGALREQRVQLALMEEASALDERVQLMFDAAPFAVNMLDKDYNIVDCNQAALTMFGMTSKDEYVAKFHECSPVYQPNGALSADLWHKYRETVFGEHGGRFEWTHQKPSGELLPCEITFVRSMYRGQEISIGYTRDLSKEAYINDLKVMTNMLDKRLEQQSLMTYISQSFLSDEDMDTLITEALRKIGEFMGIDQILMHVTEDDGISFTCRYEWINPKLGLSTRVGGNFSIGKPVMDIIHRVKKHGLFYVTSNDPEIKRTIAPYRVNFQNYI
jgi:PAS domain-containing protein